MGLDAIVYIENLALTEIQHTVTMFNYFSSLVFIYRDSLRVKKHVQIIWVKVFNNGPSKIFGRKPHYFRFFKGCLPQMLFLDPYMSHLTARQYFEKCFAGAAFMHDNISFIISLPRKRKI